LQQVLCLPLVEIAAQELRSAGAYHFEMEELGHQGPLDREQLAGDPERRLSMRIH